MSIKIYMPSPYRDLTNGVAHVEAEGHSLADIVSRLDAAFPGFKERVCEGEEIRHFVNVYVNGQEMRSLRGVDTALEPGDEVAFVPMMAGGAPSECPHRIELEIEPGFGDEVAGSS